MVHLVWNLGWYSRTELTIPTPTVKINDGNWHMLKVDRVRQSLDVEIDGEVYNSRVTGSYYELNTANSVLLGKKKQKMYLCVNGHFISFSFFYVMLTFFQLICTLTINPKLVK